MITQVVEGSCKFDRIPEKLLEPFKHQRVYWYPDILLINYKGKMYWSHMNRRVRKGQPDFVECEVVHYGNNHNEFTSKNVLLIVD